MSQASDLFDSQLSRLPTNERAELAQLLLQSLDDSQDADAEAAWQEEIARRVSEIESGRAVGRPADEVMAELRRRQP
ncbi:MAG: addiction module component [Pirellula sp.]|nr:addiction module component [Pirellula sp.]